MKLYGIGRRGVAVTVYPGQPDLDRPVPLWRDRAEPEAIIAKLSLRGLHLIAYEVKDNEGGNAE